MAAKRILRAGPVALMLCACSSRAPAPGGEPPGGGGSPCNRTSQSGAGQLATAIHVADVTGDGRPDVLVVYRDSGVVSLYEGHPDGTLSLRRSDQVGAWPLDVAVTDLDHDDRADVLVVGHFSNALMVLRGLGGGELESPTVYPLGNHSQRLELGDFDRDGNVDVVTKNAGSAGVFEITVLLGRGDGTLGSAQPYPLGDLPADIAVADFNGDGSLDVAVAMLNTSVVEVFSGRGDGTLDDPYEVALSAEPLRMVTADVNEDGLPDLLVCHGLVTPGYIALYLGRGDGTFAPEQRIGVNAPYLLAVADLDGDGTLDLVVTSLTTGIFLLRGDPVAAGTFGAPVELAAGASATALGVAALDPTSLPAVVWSTQEDTLEVERGPLHCAEASSRR